MRVRPVRFLGAFLQESRPPVKQAQEIAVIEDQILAIGIAEATRRLNVSKRRSLSC